MQNGSLLDCAANDCDKYCTLYLRSRLVIV